jgi:RluA family pseudouridine synthase
VDAHTRPACHAFAIADKFRQGAAMPPILFRDDRFVVLDKPAGLPVHPGPRGRPSVEDWFPLLSLRKQGPWLAHRLDADTSGCLLVALRRSALLAAQAEFAAGRVRKTYWAVVHGVPSAVQGIVDEPLGRRSTPNGWHMVRDPGGKPAVTGWRVLGHGDGLSWLELSPRTGRTHQVRAHCAMIGCPVLGDPVYGGGAGRLHLLARRLELELAPPVVATAPVPDHMREALARSGCAFLSSRQDRGEQHGSGSGCCAAALGPGLPLPPPMTG